MKIIKLNIITLIFFSCSIISPELEWEDVKSDHESVLNILGILSTDSLVSSFVKVHKSLNVQDNIDSLVLDTTSGIDFYRISKFVVVDAEVIVRQGSDEYHFEYSEIEMETGDTVGLGAYFYNGDDLNPLPGEVYSLSVTTPSGMNASGEVIIPPKPRLHKEEFPDTFKVNDIINIKWDVLSEHNQLLNIDNFLNLLWFLYNDYGFNYNYGNNPVPCGLQQQQFIYPGDTTWTFKKEWCSDNESSQSSWDEDLLLINLMSMDQNYYDFFIKYSQQGSEFSNLYIGSGGTGRNFGIEGGIGIFGSVGIDRHFIPILP